MRKYLIASHGSFSSGIKSSLDLIIGETENVFIIDAYVGENKSIESDLKNVLTNLKEEDELIVFTDLMGGSITNQILQYALRQNVHVVAGINLPLLIDVLLADASEPIAEIIESAITKAREHLVYVNKSINKEKEHD